MTRWKVPDERPRVSPDRIRRFLDDYGAVPFRHAGEVIPLLRRDAADESRTVARDGLYLTEDLRSTYRIRAKTTAMAAPSANYPPGLAGDVREFVAQLDAAKDQPLCSWSIDLPSGICFLAFELLDDRVIAGFVKSADQRVVNPDSRFGPPAR
jgi:hypothetical protein